MTRFLFDVDGTLTESRQRIDPIFLEFMIDFCHYNKTSFVTGSEREKTVEQIGEELFNKIDYSFNCAGNEIWSYGKLIQVQYWVAPHDLHEYLEKMLSKSKFFLKTGRHIEYRNGMINFSIPGGNCDRDTRNQYILWDKSTAEREHLQAKLSRRFPDIDVFIGGETGLDIYAKGRSKEQVIPYLKKIENEKTYYFGDQIFLHGNDYNVAMKCNHRYAVRGWRDTYEILSYLKEVDCCL